MKFLPSLHSFGHSEAFDRDYPIIAALRRSNARIGQECEQVWRVFDEFARSIVDPVAIAIDREAEAVSTQLVVQVLTEACKRRIFSLSLPRSLGGQGVTMLALTIGLERLAASCLGVANLLAVHGLGLAIMGAAGAISNLRHVAARIVECERRGKPFLISTAATEPAAGTDMEDAELLGLAQLECEAAAVPNGWVLNGTKIFVSNGSLAEAFVILLPTDLQNPVQTLSAFFVERSRLGFEVRRVEHKLGQRACPAAEIRLANCFIPNAHKLNTQSVAGRTLDLVLGASRVTVAAFASGAAFGVLHDCIELMQSHQFRQSSPAAAESTESVLAKMWCNARLARSSYLEAQLANSAFGLVSLMEAAALRQLDRVVPPGVGAWASQFGILASPLLNREARRWLDQLSNRNIAMAAAYGAAAKATCSQLALSNCELANELMGPWLTLESQGLSKRWRDARLLPIYEGTNELNMHDVYKHAVRPEIFGSHD